jgi:hypothetical protein
MVAISVYRFCCGYKQPELSVSVCLILFCEEMLTISVVACSWNFSLPTVSRTMYWNGLSKRNWRLKRFCLSSKQIGRSSNKTKRPCCGTNPRSEADNAASFRVARKSRLKIPPSHLPEEDLKRKGKYDKCITYAMYRT